jgi:hypothetical protein
MIRGFRDTEAERIFLRDRLEREVKVLDQSTLPRPQ